MCPVDFTPFQFLSELSSCSVAAASRSGSRSASVPICWFAYSLIAWCKAFRSRPGSRVSKSTNASTSDTRSGGSLLIFSINSCCSTNESIALCSSIAETSHTSEGSYFLADHALGWTVYVAHNARVAIFRMLNQLISFRDLFFTFHDFWISSESVNDIIRRIVSDGPI